MQHLRRVGFTGGAKSLQKCAVGNSGSLVAICRFGRLLDFFVGLVQVFFRFSGVTAHVLFIGCLRSRDFGYGLLDGPLCGKQVRVPAWTYVLANQKA
jgi:hypothetical protein